MKTLLLLGVLLFNIIAQDDQFGDTAVDSTDQVDEEILFSCILLARYQLSYYGTQLVEIVKAQESYEEKNQVWKKMYTSHVIHCQKHMTVELSENLLNDLEGSQQDLKKYFAMFSGLDLDNFKQGIWSREIIAEEETLWKAIEDFESSLSEKKNQAKASDYLKELQEKRKQAQPQTAYKPKTSSKIYDIAILFSAFGAIGFLFYSGLTKLSGDTIKRRQRRKQQ